MLAVGLRTVLEPEEPEDRPVPSHAGLLRQAIHPLAVPTLLNPAGIAAAILLSSEIATSRRVRREPDRHPWRRRP